MRILLILIFITGYTGAFSQVLRTDSIPPGRSHSLAAEAVIPFGEFSETHSPGAGLRYEYWKEKTGSLQSMPAKKWGLISGAGIGWHDGRKETPGLGYTYLYDDFFYGYAFGGLGFLPCRKGSVSLTAGPAISSYSATRRFNIYAAINGSYYPFEKVGINAGIRLLKENGASAMAMGTVGAKYVF